MSIHITGDTHIDYNIKKLASKKFPEQRKMSKEDYVIVAGDFGLLWKNVPDDTERHWTKWLNEKRFTTLFVDGNHENFERIKSLPIIEKFNGKVGQISDSIFHLRRGEIYTINGMKFFCFGGARSHDKNSRRLAVSWWPEEEPTVAETEYAINNLANHNWTIDFIITHTLPDKYAKHIGLIPYHDVSCSTRKFLDHVLQMTTFKKWYCGHWHEDDIRQDKFHLLYHKIVEVTL